MISSFSLIIYVVLNGNFLKRSLSFLCLCLWYEDLVCFLKSALVFGEPQPGVIHTLIGRHDRIDKLRSDPYESYNRDVNSRFYCISYDCLPKSTQLFTYI